MNDTHSWIPLGRVGDEEGDCFLCEECGAQMAEYDDGRVYGDLLATLACQVGDGAAL